MSEFKAVRNGRSRKRWRRLRASWRDTLLLLREFRRPLLSFFLLIAGLGFLYYFLAETAGQPLQNPLEAIYLVLSLAFLQPLGHFPDVWYLELFFFAMPLFGIILLAQGLTEFGVMLFNRRTRNKEWEMAVASTFDNHIVLVGLGHLGFRVVRELYKMGQEVVVIELKPEDVLISAIRKMDIPVIHADGTREAALEAAGVRQARTIVVCTQNDSLNLQMSLKARSLNPAIEVVLRIFDDDFAEALEKQFGFRAMSATGMAAPAFAATAAGADITRPITIEGQALSLARLDIAPRSALAGRTIAEAEQQYDVSIVFLRHDSAPDMHPAGDRWLAAGDVVAILGGPEQLKRLVADNR
jgi:Trk K+ transport system NAD-binding subunit